jgi:hypothetical protein
MKRTLWLNLMNTHLNSLIYEPRKLQIPNINQELSVLTASLLRSIVLFSKCCTNEKLMILVLYQYKRIFDTNGI